MTVSKAKRGVILANLRSLMYDITTDAITPQVWDMTIAICRKNLFPEPATIPIKPCPELFEAPAGGVTEPEPVAMVVPDVVVPTATKSKAKA